MTGIETPMTDRESGEIVRTGRLILRPFKIEDAQRVRALINNWNIASMLARVPYPYPEGMAEEWIESHGQSRAARTDFPLAIEAQGELVGTTGIHEDKDAGGFEFGYWIGQPYWGRGYATEAGQGMVRYAFTQLRLKRLVAGHFADNPASGRVLTKLGFRYSGQTQRHCLAREMDVACRLMELKRQDVSNG